MTIVLCEQQSIVFIRKKVASLLYWKSGTKTSLDNLNIILSKIKEFILKKKLHQHDPKSVHEGLNKQAYIRGKLPYLNKKKM